ncbi:uncharacterized protein FOMMEDRAFT_141947 [Fomitiporia mediterranea MF3/22]|uniref:uncharacterized protein n=1 Tax=Fomitiporia mediterranea (strain MF3/22) TaxID=694068 RepID=UPI00044081C3|nr:uncharacterized protein FOMMEDRAFT_141947 [Fomitiporia mediterranea MF3/22]EJD01278.1 hypothetical protein FOMMEDRAFT_141947 [Fomitiporia mediterranea MF3/22]
MPSISNQVDTLVTRVHARYTACYFKQSDNYQYTVLAAFVLESPYAPSTGYFSHPDNYKVVALATGVKCLPTDRYPLRGDALHDSHAEVLARRAFIRWLHEEVQRAVHASKGSMWIKQRTDGKWELGEGVKLHMYISTVSCGDASMRFLASSQDPAMAALKDAAPPASPPPGAASRGRNNYALHTVLRTKPGRADSPPTICMSCSDKIAVYNVLGVQGALAANLFAPIYLSRIIIGDVPEHMQDVVRLDCERAFYRRLDSIQGLPDSYHLTRPTIYFTHVDFENSRTALQGKYPKRPLPQSSNESLCWFADSVGGKGQEVIINGIRRGVGPKQLGLERFRPLLCKLQLFRLHEQTKNVLGLPPTPLGRSYHTAKQSDPAYTRARSLVKGPGGPFAGWIVSGEQYEAFDVDGDILGEIPTEGTPNVLGTRTID